MSRRKGSARGRRARGWGEVPPRNGEAPPGRGVPLMDWKFVANCAITILAILDPLGALAMFLALLGDATHEQRRRGALLAALTVLTTLTVAMLLGRQLLGLLGISMGAFRVAGG